MKLRHNFNISWPPKIIEMIISYFESNPEPLKSIFQEGQFTYFISGKQIPDFLWHQGEPNGFGDCGDLVSSNFELYDSNCDNLYIPLCQRTT